MEKRLLLIFGIFYLFACNSTRGVYMSEDAKSVVLLHKKIAILPPQTLLTSREYLSPYQLTNEQFAISQRVAQNLYSTLLKRKSKGYIVAEILDQATTNAILQQYQYPQNPMTPKELADALQVDALISAELLVNRPMTNFHIAVMDSVGRRKAIMEEGNLSMTLYDKTYDKSIWTYTGSYRSGINDAPNQQISAMLYHACKKMPYGVK